MEQLRSPPEASKLPETRRKAGAVTAAAAATAAAHPGNHGHHRWKTREGEKRTITIRYQASDTILKYLMDMRQALTEALAQALALALTGNSLQVPDPITLRRKVKPWFDTKYAYARHHVNPLCRAAVALLKSYRKRHRRLVMPRVRRLAMRIDSELFRVETNGDGSVALRGTLEPFTYETITFTPSHRKWSRYSSSGGSISEILMTDRKLAETRGRQRNRVKDELHKLSTRIVRENPDTSFVFENLKNIRGNGGKRRKKMGRELRMYLNRWPYRAFQSMVDYKSRCRTLYVSPWGTSSRCPVCGGELKHPAWAVSRCRTCGVDYDRDRLASIAILLRGLRLCGQPFAVSADASWQYVKDEYLYAPRERKAGGAGETENATSAPNRDAENFHVFPHF